MKTKHHHFESIHSTQDQAKENLPTLDLEKFHVFTAQEQTKGRGRFNRHWHSPKGLNAYITYAFSVNINLKSASSISLMTGLTIAEVLQKLGLKAELKWPNDIYVDGKKMGGILVESTTHDHKTVFFVGFGLNINMDQNQLSHIDCPATSLFAETNKTWNLNLITEPIETLFKRNLEIFLEKGFEAFQEDFEAISFLADKTITLDLGKETLTGQYCCVNSDGALVLKLKDGEEKAFYSGEITNWE